MTDFDHIELNEPLFITSRLAVYVLRYPCGPRVDDRFVFVGVFRDRTSRSWYAPAVVATLFFHPLAEDAAPDCKYWERGGYWEVDYLVAAKAARKDGVGHELLTALEGRYGRLVIDGLEDDPIVGPWRRK